MMLMVCAMLREHLRLSIGQMDNDRSGRLYNWRPGRFGRRCGSDPLAAQAAGGCATIGDVELPRCA
jgi:hypothetical protein